MHPCPFPEELARQCIEASCPPGGTVADPFCGSGTTLLAARKLGRLAIGIDFAEKYLDRARARLMALSLD